MFLASNATAVMQIKSSKLYNACLIAAGQAK